LASARNILVIVSLLIGLTGSTLARDLVNDEQDESLFRSAELGFEVNSFIPIKSEATSYGEFTSKESLIYQIDEPLLFYAEPSNYGFRHEGGLFKFHIAVDFELRSLDGVLLANKKDLIDYQYSSLQPLFDFYVNLKHKLTGVPKGEYDVVFTFKDIIGKNQVVKTHRVALQ
jgi:hypothetical protein